MGHRVESQSRRPAGKVYRIMAKFRVWVCENEVETDHRSAPLALCQWTEGLETMRIRSVLSQPHWPRASGLRV